MSNFGNLDYIKYFEPHFALNILEFLLKNNQNNEELKNLYNKLLSNSQEYEKIKENKILNEDKINELKEKNNKEIEELENNLKGFLNLCDKCQKQNKFDLNSFSFGKKIIDETNPQIILQYCKKLFDNNSYDKAKNILNAFYEFNKEINKNHSKNIYSLYLLYLINIITKEDSKIIEKNFIKILNELDNLKIVFDEELKKINFDSVEKNNIDFKQILLYRGYIIHWALFLLENNNIQLFLTTLFNDNYYIMIENVFTYIFKYIIVFSIISKSKKFIKKINESIDNYENYFEKDDKFFNLFKEMFIEFDIKNSILALNECKNIMKNDYFLYNYVTLFENKCIEILIENYIIINEKINISDFIELFGNDINKTKEYIKNLIKRTYPLALIKDINDNEIEYELDKNDIQLFYNIKTNELYNLTSSMINYLNINSKK